MEIFKCKHCGNLIYVENTSCVKCGYPLGFDLYPFIITSEVMKKLSFIRKVCYEIRLDEFMGIKEVLEISTTDSNN